MLVCHTTKAKDILEKGGYWNVEIIQHGIDIKKFKFLDNYDNNRMIGYVGRIVPWKGLYDILKVAKEIESEVVMMGRVDKADVWKECQEFSNQMDIRFGTPDDKQTEVYHEMGVYVGNSCDNIEEGCLGLLEAMACGIPVITTPSGEAKDIIKDGENGILIEFENYESLKNGIKRFFDLSLEEKNKMREKAWDTVKNMNGEAMARKYEKLYYKTLFPKDLVSVIIPTCNREDIITNVLDAYSKQTYQPIELIICVDDKKVNGNYDVIIEKWKEKNRVPVKLLFTDNVGYGIAQARNMGIFEATGNYLIFSDDRFLPKENAVEIFVNNLKTIKEPSAVWGNKGAGKRDFIENFFIIRKKDIVNAGMFNERIDKYGGQSQELRERLRKLNYNLQFENGAEAVPQISTHSKNNKRYDILEMKTKLWKLRN